VEQAILARHGESELSVRGRTNGDPRVVCGLTELGCEQALRLGRLLATTTIELCVVSEFQRAQETTDLALAERDIPRLVLRELNDIRFGEFEGRALSDYRAWARAHSPEDPAPGGGESRVETVRRYIRGYRTILARPEGTILVLAHGLPVRYVLDALAERVPAPAVEQVPYAEPFRIGASELTAAVERLQSWAEQPSWTS
jgi:2,3-bisphosphoglycerate-dependent phosphoglycerate mutase